MSLYRHPILYQNDKKPYSIFLQENIYQKVVSDENNNKSICLICSKKQKWKELKMEDVPQKWFEKEDSVTRDPPPKVIGRSWYLMPKVIGRGI